MILDIQKAIGDMKMLVKNVLPKSRTEILLASLLLLFYLSYSLFLALKTTIIDSTEYICDIYFNFDNPSVFEDGSGFMGAHPLQILFLKPIIILGKYLIIWFGYKAKTILFTLFCGTHISLASAYTFRYLHEVVVIKKSVSLLLSLFFAFFMGNLILSFSPESYTLSGFLLPFSLCFYSMCISKKQEVPFLSSLILAVFLGGVTITNFAKGILPIFFLNESRKLIWKRILWISFIFFAIFCALNVVRVLTGKEHLFFSFFSYWDSSEMGEKPSFDLLVYLRTIVDQFWGAPIFSPEIIQLPLMRAAEFYPEISIDMGSYRRWWQYSFVVLIFAFVVAAIIRNYKHKLVKLICGLLLIDVVIHCVLGFGVESYFIYGSHWIYCIPLLLGWLYKSLNEKMRKVLVGTYLTLFVVLIVNNFYRLSEFIDLAVDLFPV